MGRRIVWRDDGPTNGLEWAPPIMVVAVVTLFASTLDLMADFLVCSRLLANVGDERAIAGQMPRSFGLHLSHTQTE
ncbi:hypothetical protein ANCCAN_26169 [Ancylostoma caninum]|uniref:Uncharacterized protein n=1 Tax=Ancylostoma caninum TaxID=29170 RepID=A0A368F7L5_ANCCA|nr:hypothetical protein ANCCAN_26169 [Ancylostoma caninum]